MLHVNICDNLFPKSDKLYVLALQAVILTLVQVHTAMSLWPPIPSPPPNPIHTSGSIALLNYHPGITCGQDHVMLEQLAVCVGTPTDSLLVPQVPTPQSLPTHRYTTLICSFALPNFTRNMTSLLFPHLVKSFHIGLVFYKTGEEM